MAKSLDLTFETAELSNIERELTIKISGSDVAKELNKAYKTLAPQVNIKGYRKGKAPRYILEQYYKGDIHQKVLESLINTSFPQVAIESKLAIISDPEISDLSELISGMDFSYKAKVELKPEIIIKESTGLSLEKNIYTADEKALEKHLEMFQDRQVQVIPVENRDVIEQNDLVESTFSGTVDGEEVKELGGINYVIEIGSGRFYPEAEQAFIGKKIGEKFEVEVKIPEDHQLESAQGKTAKLSINPIEIKIKKRPELDDEFAQAAMKDVKTLAELKTKIQETLEKDYTERSKQELRNDLVDQLIKLNPVEIPNSLVKRQAERMAMQSLQQIPQEYAEQIWKSQGEQLLNEVRPRAQRLVHSSLLIEQLMMDNKIEVQDADIENKYIDLAEQMGQSLDAVKKMYKQQNAEDEIKHMIASDMLMDSLIASSKVSESTKEAPLLSHLGMR